MTEDKKLNSPDSYTTISKSKKKYTKNKKKQKKTVHNAHVLAKLKKENLTTF